MLSALNVWEFLLKTFYDKFHWKKIFGQWTFLCFLWLWVNVPLKSSHFIKLVVPSTLYTTFRVLYSPLYQAAMQAYLLSTIEEKSWAQMNKNTLFLVWKWWFSKASNLTIFEPNCLVFVPEWRFWLYLSIEVIIHNWKMKIKNHYFGKT